MDNLSYLCAICFDECKDPVVTCCGHLFDWDCILKWKDQHDDDFFACP